MKFGRTESLALLILFISFLITFTLADEADDDAEQKDDPTVVILFMFFGLGLGIVVMQFLSIFGEAIPYTCVVFILGIIFSSANKHTGVFGESISNWVGIDAELVLFVFLPPLIFGEAMSLNWYHVKGGIVQALILAGPGVIFGAVAMGVVTKYLLPYNWGWNISMTFGAILSATDPVAVVALLKGACASPKLTILIVGESLLNDGTAMVLFTVFFNALNGKVYTAGSILSFFFAAAVGSVMLGVGFGLVTVRWLRSANRPLKETDVTIQIAITICCAYLVFFTAQYSLEISGVLACCGAGIMLAWLAPPIILSHETMHNVWGMMEWVLNTLIFLLAGLIIGHRVLDKVQAIDWLYCVALYFILMVLRAITIIILYPWVSTIGHKCTRNEAIFMSWAGLRGALGMTLALIVEKSGPKDLEEETSRLFFYVGGIAALTLLINATTAKQLLVFLGLLGGDSAEKTLVMNQIKKKLRRKMDRVVEQMAAEFSFTPEDLDEVRMSCTLLSEVRQESFVEQQQHLDTLVEGTDAEEADSPLRNMVGGDNSTNPLAFDRQRTFSKGSKVGGSFSQNPPQRRGSRRGSTGSFAAPTNRQRSQSVSHQRALSVSRMLSMSSRGHNPVVIHELLKYVRAIFLEIVRVKYWHNIEGGKLPRLSHSAQFLLYSVEVGLDEVGELTGARDWACVSEELDHVPLAVRALSFLEDYMPRCCSDITSRTVGQIEARNEKRAVYMLTSFIEAHEHAQRKIHAFIGADEDGDPDSPQTPEEVRVIGESIEAVRKAKLKLDAMSVDTITAIRSKQAARLVLAKEAEMVKSMVQEGLITSNHAEEFLEEIGSDTARIEKERNRMYREQAVLKGKNRQARKQEATDTRRSLFDTVVGNADQRETLLDK